MTPQETAEHLTSMGFRVFPCDQTKQPRVPKGWDWRDEREYEWRDDDLVGVAVPVDCVVLDVDDLALFRETGLDVTMSQYSATRRENGLHIYYRTDGREAPQVTEGKTLGYDTRVGGKGYVICWNVDDWTPAATWAMAPEWLYTDNARPSERMTAPVDAPMGTRNAILSALGTIAVKLPIPLTAGAYLALLRDWRESGRVVALDPRRPWTDDDLAKLAFEASKWEAKPDWWDSAFMADGWHVPWEQSDSLLAFFQAVLDGLLERSKGAVAAVATTVKRHLRMTPASSFTPRRVRWLWEGRLALGSVSLTGGREGQGKTLMALDLAAAVTRGRLEGEYIGHPMGVIVVTTEDSWEHTIVPRLMAAGADLTRVYRAEVERADGVMEGLNLPHDNAALEHAITEHKVALIILDPLLARLDAALDTHKDAEVRLALEPLVAIAQRTGAHITGLIHVNKTQTTDPLTSIMASRAFVAVSRAVLFVMKDPEETGVRLVGLPKNNLGRTDMPTLRFSIDVVTVGSDPDDGKDITAPKMHWLETTDRSVEDALGLVLAPKSKSLTEQAAQWLLAYLRLQEDYKAPRSDIMSAAQSSGWSETHLRRARERLDIAVEDSNTMPRFTYWQLPISRWPQEPPPPDEE